jgi:hypothetical protein
LYETELEREPFVHINENMNRLSLCALKQV